MYKFALIASVLTTVVLTTVPVTAQQGRDIDVRIGQSPNNRWNNDFDRNRHRRHSYENGIGHCRMVTIQIQRDDGRVMTRRERRCD